MRRCDDLPATITHVPVAALLVLNTPDDGRLRPKHVQWPCRNKTCTVLHQVGVSFELKFPTGYVTSVVRTRCTFLGISTDSMSYLAVNTLFIYHFVGEGGKKSVSWEQNLQNYKNKNKKKLLFLNITPVLCYCNSIRMSQFFQIFCLASVIIISST